MLSGTVIRSPGFKGTSGLLFLEMSFSLTFMICGLFPSPLRDMVVLLGAAVSVNPPTLRQACRAVRPGTYTLERNSVTLLKLISLAGGCNENRGPTAYIVRGNAVESLKKRDEDNPGIESIQKEIAAIEGRIEVDLSGLLDQGDPGLDQPIYGGDYVLIAPIGSVETGSLIWVEGQVKQPGSISYQPGLTALQACLKVGGFTDTAAPNRTTISRKGEGNKPQIIKVKLKDISRNKRPDVPLKPGDRITVPESIF